MNQGMDRRQRIRPTADGPILNLPRVLQWLIGVNLLVHALRWVLPGRYDGLIILNLGFIPALFSHTVQTPLLVYLSPVTYMFLHGGLAHLLINMATLAAFGTPIARIFGPTRALAFYLLSGLGAVAAHYALYSASPYPMIGASGAISGMFAGTLLLMRRFNRRASDRKANAIMIAVWVGMTVLFALFDVGIGGENVAWVAHLGGFVAGLLLFPLLQPRRDHGDAEYR